MTIYRTEVEEIIRDLFEEEALAIGGLVALHDIDDDLVWRLVKSLDVIRGKVFRRLDEQEATDEEEKLVRRRKLKPHPAIEEFLFKLRREE